MQMPHAPWSFFVVWVAGYGETPVCREAMLEGKFAEQAVALGDLRPSHVQEWVGMMLFERLPGQVAESRVAVLLLIPRDEGKCTRPVLADLKGMDGRRLQLPFAFYPRLALPVCHGTHPV
jgi:hypothetical protein